MNDLLREIVDKDLIVRHFEKTFSNGIFMFILKKIIFIFKLTKDQRAKITQHFSSSGTRSLIEKRLLSYLNYNGNHLPMYAKPDMV